MRVTAVIVNYHTDCHVRRVVEELCGSPAVDQIIIVDNSGSFDPGKMTTPPAGSTALEVMTPGKNIGFGAGVNMAARRSKADWILLVNPDMCIPPDAVETLVAGAESNNVLLAGPRFFWDDEKKFRLPPALGASAWLEFAQISQGRHPLDAAHLGFYWQIRHERFWSAQDPFVEPFLSGACILVNREWAFKHHNGIFDDRFFMYYEDTDLAARALMDGLPPLCIPGAEMVHYYNQAPEPGQTKLALMRDSHAAFMAKHYPGLTLNCNFEGGYSPECELLDPFDPSHLFQSDHPAFSDQRSHVEIGVNPYFVPFIQADFPPLGGFRLTARVWEDLAAGDYFLRFRNPVNGVQKIWKWRKG